MTRLLRRASLRFYLRHPWQLGLAIAGISLGVGVYVGVSLATASAAPALMTKLKACVGFDPKPPLRLASTKLATLSQAGYRMRRTRLAAGLSRPIATANAIQTIETIARIK